MREGGGFPVGGAWAGEPGKGRTTGHPGLLTVENSRGTLTGGVLPRMKGEALDVTIVDVRAPTTPRSTAGSTSNTGDSYT